jgi:hypothetical protein
MSDLIVEIKLRRRDDPAAITIITGDATVEFVWEVPEGSGPIVSKDRVLGLRSFKYTPTVDVLSPDGFEKDTSLE